MPWYPTYSDTAILHVRRGVNVINLSNHAKVGGVFFFLSEKESKHIKQLVKMIEHIYKIEKYRGSSTGSPFTQPRLLPYLELKPLQKRQTLATNLRHFAWWTVERSCFQCFGKILGERHCGLGSHHILFGCCILKNLNINASAKTIGRWVFRIFPWPCELSPPVQLWPGKLQHWFPASFTKCWQLPDSLTNSLPNIN